MLKAEGVNGTGGGLVTLTALMGMESKNYCTNESANLLECGVTL